MELWHHWDYFWKQPIIVGDVRLGGSVSTICAAVACNSDQEEQRQKGKLVRVMERGSSEQGCSKKRGGGRIREEKRQAAAAETQEADETEKNKVSWEREESEKAQIVRQKEPKIREEKKK